jgi:hypothetical protein
MATILAFIFGGTFGIALFLWTQMIYVGLVRRRNVKVKSKKIGFAKMSPEKRKEISRMGGLAAQRAKLNKKTRIKKK